MRIWIINPFDQLPNESDVPLRYWALCRTLAAQGHDVIWWSSDFSHLTKSKRPPCPYTDGFSVRLIATPPYTKNISLARLKNHKAFADGFYTEAMAALQSGTLKAPDRIVVSLPPLGVAEAAFRIRDHANRSAQLQQANPRPTETEQRADDRGQKSDKNAGSAGASRTASTQGNPPSATASCIAAGDARISHPPSAISHHDCQVVVDIMDAWPETFYQALPKPLRKCLGPILLAPLHRSAKRAYHGADKISAVGQSYLNLAAHYLKQRTGDRGQKTDQSRSCGLQPQHLGAEATRETTAKARRYGHPTQSRSSTASCIAESEEWISNQSLSHIRTCNPSYSSVKPTMLCYHGTDLSRFQRDRSESNTASSKIEQGTDDRRQRPEDSHGTAPPSHDGGHNRNQERTNTEQQAPHSPSIACAKRFTRHSPLPNQPLKAVYLGAMGSGYDLQTIIDVAARWKTEGVFPFQIHFAGAGPQLEQLKARCAALGLLAEDRGQETETSSERSDKTGCKADRTSQTPDDAGIHQAGEERSEQPSHLNTFPPSHDSSSIDIPRVVYHGHLAKTPITVLLESSHLALIPNRPDSLVACPYKAGEYAAAGLPMLSCLGGELGNLLKQWNAGSEYEEGDSASLHAAFEKYSTDPEVLKQQSLNARNMAEALFDREASYRELAEFILKPTTHAH